MKLLCCECSYCTVHSVLIRHRGSLLSNDCNNYLSSRSLGSKPLLNHVTLDRLWPPNNLIRLGLWDPGQDFFDLQIKHVLFQSETLFAGSGSSYAHWPVPTKQCPLSVGSSLRINPSVLLNKMTCNRSSSDGLMRPRTSPSRTPVNCWQQLRNARSSACDRAPSFAARHPAPRL